MATLTPTWPSSSNPASRSPLMAVARRPWCKDFYLAGTAALDLYLDHRSPHVFDLMSGTNSLRGPDRREILHDLLAWKADCQVETARDGYLFVRCGESFAAKLYSYPYPLVEPTEMLEELAIASPMDLALMKLGAIISRGTKRDFVDFYLLCRHLPLAKILEAAERKFGHVRDFPLQALKGLADLSLLGDERLPPLKISLQWSQVSTWLQEEVRELGRRHVGLEGH